MEIPDLFEFPPRHPPSPYIYPVLLDPIAGFEPSAERIYEVAELQPGLTLLAVGWLGSRVPARGPVPDEFVDRLFDAHEFKALKSRNEVLELRKIIPDGTAGSHACEVCTVPRAPLVRWRSREAKVPGHSHHLVRLGDVVFMCPTLILHYIVDHAYQPPSQFVRAVIEGAFLALGDLVTRHATGEELFREIKAEASRSGGIGSSEEDIRRREARKADWIQWLEAMPPCLKRFDCLGHYRRPNEMAEVLRTLEETYPDATERAVALFAWFGSGSGPWSGFPAYESWADELLLTLPIEPLLKAAASPELSVAGIEGVARFFAGWGFRTKRSGEVNCLPDSLKRTLLEHSLRSTDSDKRTRAQKAFG